MSIFLGIAKQVVRHNADRQLRNYSAVKCLACVRHPDISDIIIRITDAYNFAAHVQSNRNDWKIGDPHLKRQYSLYQIIKVTFGSDLATIYERARWKEYIYVPSSLVCA